MLSFKDIFNLIKFARSYKKKNGMYYSHKAKIDKYKLNFVSIQNKKELINYLESYN